MRNTSNFLSSLLLSGSIALSSNIAKAENNINSQLFKNLEDNEVISIDENKKIGNIPYIGEKIFLVIKPSNQETRKPYGEYKWNNDENKYFLIDHEDGEKELTLEENHSYKIVKRGNNQVRNLLQNTDDITINELKSYLNMINIPENEINNIREIENKFINFLDNLNKNNDKINLNISEGETGVIIDKSSQRIYIYQFKNESFQILGSDEISTGNPARGEDYFETPGNIIINREKFSNGDRTSEGTNSKGYGEKGNPIFFLGKYFIDKYGNNLSLGHESGLNEIHLALHNTTPWGESQLGLKMSKGCIRVSDNIITLLNKSNILESGYVMILDSDNLYGNYYTFNL